MLVASCLFGGVRSVQASDNVVVVDGSFTSAVLGTKLDFIEDPAGKLTLEDVLSGPKTGEFQRSDSDKPNFGFSESAFWVRFELRNVTDKSRHLFLQLDNGILDEITFYQPNDSGQWNFLTLGDRVPFENRTIPNRVPVFELELPARTSQVYYARLITEGSMQIPLILHDPIRFFNSDHTAQLGFGLYFGIVLVMALYNFFIFFTVRDRTYIYYVLFILAVSMFNLTLNGLAYEYVMRFVPFPLLVDNALLIFVTIIGPTGCLFTMSFLKIRETVPRFQKFLVGFAYSFGVLFIAIWIFPYPIVSKISALMAVTWTFILTCTGLFLLAKGHRAARFYTLAWFAFLVGCVLQGGRLLGIFPHTFITVHSMEVGNALEVVLLSFALADRIKLFEKEKNDAIAARVLEHERSEATQREAAQAWQGTFDAIGSCVCLLDKNALLLRANQATLDLLERAEEDILGKPLRTLLKDASGSASSSPPPGFDSISERVESFIDFKNGWYSFRHDPIHGPGETVMGSVYVMTDVTAQKELEEQLFQAQKMDAIGRLAGGVAHDFNNLLSVILSYAEFLVESATDPETKADALEIVKAGRRAATLTGQLLAFSRKQVVRPAFLNPNEIIHDLSKMLGRLMGENYKLSLDLTPKVGRIFFPKGQLDQILVNLVVNARDALPASGEVAIETEWVELAAPKQTTTGELRSGKYLKLCVRDWGKGMDAVTVARIFEPFFTTKGLGKGTGLGLSMVYGCAHQSGGAIDVISHQGKGTCMSVYLPRADDAASKTSLPPMWDKAQGQGQRVLVVEDEPPVAAAIRKILSAVGYRVFHASSAEAALELLEREAEPMDILLTDIIMSGMTGVELGSTVAEQFPNTQILYMSGYCFEVLSQQGIDPATVHVLPKPFTREELLGALMGRE
jgi:signal transduction histidine kinase